MVAKITAEKLEEPEVVVDSDAANSLGEGSSECIADSKVQLENEAATFMERLATFRIENSLENGGYRPQSQKMLDSLASAKMLTEEASLTRVIRVTLEWQDLTYRVTVGRRKKRTEKTILLDSTAAVPAGRLLAIMGPTGCGKTSLVNALSGRIERGNNGVLEGAITVNGIPRGRGFRRITAYVMQDDVLFYNLTVRETLEFAASMRLPGSVPSEVRSQLVTGIINELGLAKAQNTYIGNNFVRGVSGGERKRCNVAIEMISNPSLIFLDEPTSGLDAFQAQNVMESLWSLARSGRSVISTIHQPRSSIFKMFDLLLLLSEGRTMYYGPADKAVEWFSTCGFPCPAHFNPADFFLDVVSMDHRTPELEKSSQARINLLASTFQAQGAGLVEAEVPKVARADSAAMQEVNEQPGYPHRPPMEFWLLLQRAWKQQSRDRGPQIITIMQSVVIGFVLAALYSQMEMNQTGINDAIGILFFCCIFSAMGAMFGAMSTFPVDRAVVNRERAGKAYHVLPFYCAKFICDMPLRVGQGLVFGVIVYFIVGLNPSAAAFFKFVALLILEGLAAQSMGVAISAGVKNEKVAMAIAPAMTTILMLFGGFYVNRETIPAAIRWIEYLSHLYYAFMGLAVNNFQGRTGWACDGPPGTGCLSTGDQILARLGFDSNPLWEAYLGLACLVFFYNALGYLLLRFKKPRFLPLAPQAKKRA